MSNMGGLRLLHVHCVHLGRPHSPFRQPRCATCKTLLNHHELFMRSQSVSPHIPTPVPNDNLYVRASSWVQPFLRKKADCDYR